MTITESYISLTFPVKEVNLTVSPEKQQNNFLKSVRKSHNLENLAPKKQDTEMDIASPLLLAGQHNPGLSVPAQVGRLLRLTMREARGCLFPYSRLSASHPFGLLGSVSAI